MSNRSACFLSVVAACAAFVALTEGAGAAPAPSPAPPGACAQALAYEKTAASDTASAQARYDASVLGLAVNQRCADAQMKLVNEAYLLSMRAPAEHDLHIGDWQRDFTRANGLLTQCAGWPGLKGTVAGKDCADQHRYNLLIAKKVLTPQTPRPVATAVATASPAPAASPRP